MKRTDPQAYAAALARVELARMADLDARETRGPAAPPAGMGRSIDALVSHLNAAYGGANDDTTRAAKLSDIRRGVVYACTTLRADMLAGLPIYLYRATGTGGGRKNALRTPLSRLGKPPRVRGVKLRDAGAVEQVEGSPVTKLLARPNADWAGDALIRQTETGLCLVGQAHWQIHTSGQAGTGRPVALSWMKHSRLEVVKPGDRDALEGVTGRTVAGWRLDGKAPGRGGLLPSEIAWMRYVDPDDPDYGTLAPAQVAALGAESYAAAMGSNRDVFKQGLRAAGAFVPPEEMVSFGWDQAEELTRDVNDLLIGQRNNHRVPVFPFRYDFRAFNVTPKDAEFIALMEFAIEDVARAFRIPIEMVGGTRRTYQSTETADRALWQRCLAPEAAWLANELTIKLLPAFGLDDSYFLGFDLEDVVALQDDENAEWLRDQGQLTAGVLTVDEWRTDNGMEPFEAEDKPLQPGQISAALQVAQLAGTGQISPEQAEALLIYAVGLDHDAAVAIAGDGMTEPEEPPTGDDQPDQPMQAGAPRPTGRRAVEWDSAEHRGILERADKAEAPIRKAFEATVSKLFDRQLESILAQMGGDTERAARDLPTMADVARWFNRARWIKEFRTAAKPHYEDAATAAGRSVYGDLKVEGSFDTGSPTAVNYMRRKAQRFATEVNDTTWQRLRGTLANGIEAAETIPQLRDRVKAVMTSQSDNWAGVVARTETHSAYQGASVLAAKQAGEDAGLELEKEWVSALDSRVRDDHQDAHGQTRAIDEDFEVGGARGMAPGELGDPAQDVNCFPADSLVDAVGIEGAYARRYVGPLIETTTALGNKISGTPNHPVLTDRGWVKLGEIVEGDSLIGGSFGERVTGGHPYVNRVNAPIGEVFDLAAVCGFRHRTPGVDKQFHGDGQASEVDVVAVNGLLGDHGQPAIRQPFAQHPFALTYTRQTQLVYAGAPDHFDIPAPPPAHDAMASGGQSRPFLGGSLRHAGEHTFGSVADAAPVLAKDAPDSMTGDTVSIRQSLDRCSIVVRPEKVIKVRRVPFSGHVYNLQTESGLYICNGIIAHNCRCTSVYNVVKPKRTADQTSEALYELLASLPR